MSKEIIVVYQDCVLCGDRGRKKIVELTTKGFDIRKVSFVTKEGQDLCAKAVERGIGAMPFYTDGDEIFSTKLSTFTTPDVKTAEKPKKKSRKAKNKKEEVNGNNK